MEKNRHTSQQRCFPTMASLVVEAYERLVRHLDPVEDGEPGRRGLKAVSPTRFRQFLELDVEVTVDTFTSVDPSEVWRFPDGSAVYVMNPGQEVYPGDISRL